jgi:hypothetical protein
MVLKKKFLRQLNILLGTILIIFERKDGIDQLLKKMKMKKKIVTVLSLAFVTIVGRRNKTNPQEELKGIKRFQI